MACLLVPSQSHIISSHDTGLVATTSMLAFSASLSVANATGQACCASVGMRIHGSGSGLRRLKAILLAHALASVGERIVGLSAVASGCRHFLPSVGSVIARAPAVFA